ncbi:hypothetical protein SAMN05421875_104127 [Acidovorax soli]|uniref:Uncharacterized protein n=1 Tax=Acidovorax soli TaxID=592050 RepID=A0A1H3XTI9_9BURK|nr:hypothetical protein SAMN05421875_104127 [Acidovorax soli]
MGCMVALRTEVARFRTANFTAQHGTAPSGAEH